MNREYDEPAGTTDTVTVLLAEANTGLERLDKSLHGLAERLAPALGPAEELPMPSTSQVMPQQPRETSELVTRARDLVDTARRLTIRTDLLTQRVEL